jgi:hypothetical protein
MGGLFSWVGPRWGVANAVAARTSIAPAQHIENIN